MWIYESMAIMGTYSDRSMDYDIVLWTYYNASLINAIGAIIISTLLCFSHVSMHQCVRVIYFSSLGRPQDLGGGGAKNFCFEI